MSTVQPGLQVLVYIAERWVDSLIYVVRGNEWIMYIKLVIGKQIVNIASVYAPQVGLKAEERDAFRDCFIIVLCEIPKNDSIFICSELNDHQT